MDGVNPHDKATWGRRRHHMSVTQKKGLAGQPAGPARRAADWLRTLTGVRFSALGVR